ncbi:hypothetical protein OAU65_00420 [Gammaproteobacteria bacterium]|jgi:hypothetical protein|nr:hypothetical protein [Gammaproteobacteria bacterium]
MTNKAPQKSLAISNEHQIEMLDNSLPIIKKLLVLLFDRDISSTLGFFRSDVYRYFFLLTFMVEYFEGSEISQEHAISLVPQKYASRIKRLQVLKQAVELGYIIEESSTVDKRRRIYSPSTELVSEFLDGANNINDIFNKS